MRPHVTAFTAPNTPSQRAIQHYSRQERLSAAPHPLGSLLLLRLARLGGRARLRGGLTLALLALGGRGVRALLGLRARGGLAPLAVLALGARVGDGLRATRGLLTHCPWRLQPFPLCCRDTLLVGYRVDRVSF